MAYIKGSVIKGGLGHYRLTRAFSSKDAGQSEWGFAVCDNISSIRTDATEVEYFIKKYLKPVYPGKASPGSEIIKEQRRHGCAAFAKRQQEINYHLLNCPTAVTFVDFFRYGSDKGEHYFKICPKVDGFLSLDALARHSLRQRLTAMLAASSALVRFHALKVIHLDIKPTNLLLTVEGTGNFKALLIDFDNSIRLGESFLASTLVADMTYYSPELARSIIDETTSAHLTMASDVFALGLVLCQYLTNNLPTFDRAARYAYDAALQDKRLSIARIPEAEGSDNYTKWQLQINHLLLSMLRRNPGRRPSAAEVSIELHTLAEALQKIEDSMALPKIRRSSSDVKKKRK